MIIKKLAVQKGVLWLAAATLITKLIGVLQKIPLQNIAGDAVFGIYNVVYPIYQLITALTIAGIPVAVSMLMVHKKSEAERQQLLYNGVLIVAILGLIGFLLMFFGAEIIAKGIGTFSVAPSIRVLSFALWFAPITAIFRGYYQGIDMPQRSSISQIIEQCIRVLFMIAILIAGMSLNWRDEQLASGVMFGSVVGAFAATIWLLLGWTNRNRVSERKVKSKKSVATMMNLLTFAAPAAIASIVVPVTAVVDAFTIPSLLQEAHLQAMEQFGIYSRSQPLIQLVAMLMSAVAAGLIPAWVAKQQQDKLMARFMLLRRAAIVIGLASSAGLVLLAEPMNIMLYKDATGLETFMVLSITVLWGSVMAVQAPILSAVGLTRTPIVLILLAATGKGLGNTYLVPQYGIEGSAWASLVSLGVVALAGEYALHRKMELTSKQLRPRWRAYLAAGTALLVMCTVITLGQHYLYPWLNNQLPVRASAVTWTLLAVVAGAISYSATAYKIGVLTKDDWLLLKD